MDTTMDTKAFEGHTPGSWRIGGQDDWAYFVKAGSNELVVEVMNECDGRSEANARLIAAAPDTILAVLRELEVLRRALELCTDNPKGAITWAEREIGDKHGE
jgi:hypothetical protein